MIIERRIVHVLSNNVVMTKMSSGKNSIIFGKGIGFKKKPGMQVEEQDISQEFMLHTLEAIEHYEQILNIVDVHIAGLTEEVIAMAQEKLEGDFSETIHAALVDHINFAIERCRRGVHISNPFSFEIQMLYKNEYEVAQQAVRFLNERLDVQLPEDEISFLSMHFHAARKNERGTESLAVVRIVSKVLEAAKMNGLQFDDSFSSIRFISHLKGIIERVRNGATVHNPLLDKIIEEYQEYYQISKKLAEIVASELDCEITEDEIGFLVLHIERMNQRIRYKN